jgi:acyl dehydratase
MPIDPSQAIGAELPTREFIWDAKDVVRYHLGLGAGAKNTDPRELRYVYEPDLRVLPTFGLTAPAALGVAAPSFYHPQPPEIRHSGLELALTSMLHARQEIVVHRPLSTVGKASARARIADIYDRGSAAVLVQEAELTGEDGQPWLSFASEVYVQGEGGFGGHRGPGMSAGQVVVPEREPDQILNTFVLPQQAFLYRLCGENNPVHVDPVYARQAGFSTPILQGVCFFGMVCKEIVDALLDADPSAVRRYNAKFAGVVFPGDTLRTHVWRSGDEVVFTTFTGTQQNLVLAGSVSTAS